MQEVSGAFFVLMAGLEPARRKARDFKSPVSAFPPLQRQGCLYHGRGNKSMRGLASQGVQSADCRTALLYLCCLICIVAEGFAFAEATRGLSDRPLDPFGSPLPELTFSAAGGIAPVGAIEGCTHRFGSSVRISLIDMQYGSASWLRPCSRITCAVFCIAGKALRIRWLA